MIIGESSRGSDRCLASNGSTVSSHDQQHRACSEDSEASVQNQHIRGPLSYNARTLERRASRLIQI